MSREYLKRFLIPVLILLSAVTPPIKADDEHRPLPPIRAAAPWITGAQLLQKLGKPAEAAAAEEYIKGVFDATEHAEWCYADPNGKPLPKPRSADLQAQLRTALNTLPANELRRSAAKLMVRIWQDKWPCPPNGCCDE